jgi:hypothetical protein
MHDRIIDLVKQIEVAADRRDGDPTRQARLSATIAVLHEDHVNHAPKSSKERDADRLEALAETFGLDEVDADLLLLAAVPDLDANLALAVGLLRGSDGPTRMSVGLALELCELPTMGPEGFAHLDAASSLQTFGLLRMASDQHQWLSRELVVPDRVLAHLVGFDPVDPQVRSALVGVLPMALQGGDVLARAIEHGASLVWVRSRQGAAGLSLASGALAAVGLNCLAVDVARVPVGEIDELLRLAVREAAIRGSGLVVDSADLFGGAELVATLGLLAASPVPVVLVGSRPWDPSWLPHHPLVIDAPVLGSTERRAAWERANGEAEAVSALAGLRLTPEGIAQAAGYAETLSLARDLPLSAELVREAARGIGGSHTTGRCPTVGFDDLVLPDYVNASLQRLVAWARHRDALPSIGGLLDSGNRGRGIAALFAGSPGTGKTLAAEVIAGELGMELVEVDLSAIVDKYIGETEKHLEKMFHEAESRNVVLFFDEADALFGRRSGVKDAHDRYANQEVAYLLQRMERFDGITILATNLRGNVDPAFSRRMQFIVHFPDPDVPTRERLWRLYLRRLDATDPEDPIDIAHLADSVEVAGGEIRNIVVAAVYDATAAGEPLGMRHILAATVGEYHKAGRRAPADWSGTGGISAQPMRGEHETRQA